MKIALYCPNKPLSHPNPSGDLVIARGVADALNLLGHECKEIAQFRSRWFWKSPAGWSQAAASFVESWRKARSFQPDLWLTYHSYYKSPDVLGPWISRMAGAPYVLFQPMYATKWRKRSQTRAGFYMNRMALKAAAHAFANNTNDLQALGRLLPADRITYLPPGIFPDAFQRDEAAGRRTRLALGIPPGIPVLMTAARFRADVKFQSLAYLFKSLQLLTAKGTQFTLLVVGYGPMEGELKRMAADLLPGRTVFAGGAAREEMPSYYSAADVFIFPGIGESLGMVFLEAQSCRLPVIALDSPGVSQAVQAGRTGFLVEDDGGNSMALAAEMLIKDSAMRESLGTAGRKFIMEERNIRFNYLRLSGMLEEIVRKG